MTSASAPDIFTAGSSIASVTSRYLRSCRLRLRRALRTRRHLLARRHATVTIVHAKARLPLPAGKKKPAPVRWVQAMDASQEPIG